MKQRNLAFKNLWAVISRSFLRIIGNPAENGSIGNGVTEITPHLLKTHGVNLFFIFSRVFLSPAPLKCDNPSSYCDA